MDSPLDDDQKGPAVKIPPPLLTLSVIIATYLIDRLFPLPIVVGDPLWPGGSALIICALLLAVIAVIQFAKAKTPIEPWKPTSTIIQHGIYRFSRNPIYLALCIATAGIGLILNSWWIAAGIILLVMLMRRLVIDREEAYLRKKFGREYEDYKTRVRRWI